MITIGLIINIIMVMSLTIRIWIIMIIIKTNKLCCNDNTIITVMIVIMIIMVIALYTL